MPEFDNSKEYGFVLEGGGAKGAYQIGVWRAALECGVKIKGVSGVSVGALNGALMCMGDLDKAEELWRNITYSQVMVVDDEQMDNMIKKNYGSLDIHGVVKTALEILVTGGVDVTPLKKLIEEHVDEEKIRNSPIEFVLGTFSITGMKEVEITAKEAEEGYLKDFLLASAYFPLFKAMRLHGKRYVDGGMLNNVPIDMLIERGYENIVVVRIYGPGLNRPVRIPKNVNVIEISPKADLGTFLEFDGKKSIKNMKIGYCDGLRCFRNLKGKRYYLDAKKSEEWYLERFLGLHPAVVMALLEYYRLDYTREELYTRQLLERVCPMIAEELKLTKEWTYEELYLTILEVCAKTLRIARYKIYTIDELIYEIVKKYASREQAAEGNTFPIFVLLLLKIIVIEEK